MSEFVLGTLQSMDPDNYEHDVYDELLTQAEIQGNISKVNGMSIWWEKCVWFNVISGFISIKAKIDCQWFAQMAFK